MNINDIRTDLGSELEPFPEYEKKHLSVDEISENNTSDIFLGGNQEVNIKNQNTIKISKNKKYIHLFKKHKYIDGVNKKSKNKAIDISSPYINHGEKLKSEFKNISEQVTAQVSREKIKSHIQIISTDLKENTTEFIDNNIKKKNHGFKNKKIKFYKQKGFFYKISASVFFVFIFLFVFKIIIESSVDTGYQKLTEIKDGNVSFQSLQSNVNDAKFSFLLSDILYTPLSIIPNESIKNGYHIIKGGKDITKLADNSLSFFNSVQGLIQNKGLDNIYISQFLENNKNQFLYFQQLLSQSLIHYDKIGDLGDMRLQSTFDNTVIKLHKALGYIKTINLNFDQFLSLMGHEDTKDYLIVFQNNDEIRPTGGFMGSMGIISVYKGKVVDIQKSDVYAYEWEINKQYKRINEDKLPAPKGLDQITGTWGLRDSNYQPMLKDTSQDIQGFLNRIDVNIDGIIYINKHTIEEVLRVTGGVYFDSLGRNVDHENFSRVISTLVEGKVSKVGTLGTPKQILFDFSELFYEKMKENNDYVPVAKVLFDHLNSRDIMIYSFHPEENSLLWKLGINGEIPFYKSLDFAYPVFTSLSGNKSDRYIQTNYNKTVEEIGKCKFRTNLEIIRKHQYSTNEEEKVNALLNEFEIADKDHIRKIQGKGDNYQFVRIYLPRNAQISNQEGLVINKFDRYQIAEFFIKTRLYETTSNTINYIIQKENCKNYSYTLFKQPGITDYNMNITINSENITAKNVTKDFIINR